MSSHFRPSLSFYPRRRRRRRRAAASSPSEPPRSRALPPAAGTAPPPSAANHFLLARPSLDWLGIASQSHTAGADFQLGFSPPFRCPGAAIACGGRLPPAEQLRFVRSVWMRIGTRPGSWQGSGIFGYQNFSAALRRDLRPFGGAWFPSLVPCSV